MIEKKLFFFSFLVLAFLLDNTIKCDKPSDRGLHKWIQLERNVDEVEDQEKEKIISEVYNWPGILGKLKPSRIIRLIFPIFPDEKINLNRSSHSL